MSYESYKKFFDDADTDGDGFISYEDLIAMLERNGYRDSETKIKTMFDEIDIAGTDRISLEQFLTAMGVLPQKDHREASMRMVFRSFDKNNDGVIDRSELDQAFREMGEILTPHELDRLIQMGDKHGQGTLNYEDFIAEVFGK